MQSNKRIMKSGDANFKKCSKLIPKMFIHKIIPVDRIKCNSLNGDCIASVYNKITSFGTCHTHLSLDLGIVGMVPFQYTFFVTYLLHEEIWVRACLKGRSYETWYEDFSPQLNQNK